MKLLNFWLVKKNEKNILKVVEWAHRNKRKVEELTIAEIIEASKAYLRDPSHA
jgi:hypothetical protein